MTACLRCSGKGTVIYKTGYPGQDRRALSYSEIKWRPAVTKRCPVCLGTKIQQPKKNYPPPRLEVYWSTPLTREELDELLTSMEVSDDDRQTDLEEG